MAQLKNDVPHLKFPKDCCRELADMLMHLENLVVALRFSSPAWACGDLSLELDNYSRALELVKSDRARGVCQTMIGKTLRRIATNEHQPRLRVITPHRRQRSR